MKEKDSEIQNEETVMKTNVIVIQSEKKKELDATVFEEFVQFLDDCVHDYLDVSIGERFDVDGHTARVFTEKETGKAFAIYNVGLIGDQFAVVDMDALSEFIKYFCIYDGYSDLSYKLRCYMMADYPNRIGRVVDDVGHNEPPKELDKENEQWQNEGLGSSEDTQEDDWKFTGQGKSLGAFPHVIHVPLDAEDVERTQNELSNAIHAFLDHDTARTRAREAVLRYSHRLDEIPRKLQYMTDLVLRL